MLNKLVQIKEFIAKRRTVFTVLLFAIILVVGFSNGVSMGIGVDEMSEENILFMNLKPYAEIVFGPDSEFTKKLGTTDVLTSIERDHGAAPLYIAAPFCLSNTFRDNPHNFLIAYRCCVFFLSWLGMLSLYGLVKRLTGKGIYGIMAVLMFWLSPRFFAESAYNNKDMVAAALVLINLFFGYLFYAGKDKDYLSPILLGITVAFSVNTRFVGIVTFGFIGIAYLLKLTVWHEWNLHKFLRGAVSILSFVLAYYLITPAMWHGNVLSFLRYVIVESSSFSRWDKYLMVAGEIFMPSVKPIKWWYSLAYMAVTIPPVYLLLILVGIVAIFVSFHTKREKEETQKNIYILVSLAYCLAILISTIGLKAVLYNGWRHLYSLYGPMIIIAVTGFAYLNDLVKKESKVAIHVRAAAVAAILVQTIVCVAFILLNHPNEFAYFNVFAGKEVEKNWDGDWWGICSKEILQKVYEISPGASISNYEAWYFQITQMYCEDEIKQGITLEGFPNSDYIALNRMYVEYFLRSENEEWIDCDSSVVDLYKELCEQEPVFEIKSGNCLLWSVYEAP